MKLIEVNADAGHIGTVGVIAEKNEAADFRLGYKGEDSPGGSARRRSAR